MIASLRPAREKKSQYVVGSKSLKRPRRGEHQAQSCKVKSTQHLRLAWHNGPKPILKSQWNFFTHLRFSEKICRYSGKNQNYEPKYI
jgi:hypothetical protein